MRKNVLITGASGGIGSALALAFAERGYGVAMQYHSREQAARETAERICSGGGTAEIFSADISREDEVEALFDAAESRLGFLGVLVNNAAISQKGLFTDLTLEEWNRIFAVNCTGAFLCSRRVLPEMIRRKEGCILNISSMWGQVGASCEAAYSASKGAVNALTRALAKELAPSGIAVNAVACGAVDTDMNACFSPEERQEIAEEIPAGRFALPSEAADLIYTLAERPSYLTGQIIRLDGGWI